jgi:hypothetical protein
MDIWLTSTLAIAVVVAATIALGFVLVRLAAAGLARVTQTVRRSFWCPFVERRVTAELLENVQTGEAVDVTWCTAFSPATGVRCRKPCLREPGFMRPPRARGRRCRAVAPAPR